MTYELPDLPELSDIITQMLEHVVYGWFPVFDEEVTYTDGTYSYSLEAGGATSKDIHDVISVKGFSDDTETTFAAGTDYEVQDTTGNGKYDTFHWISTGTLPDDGTIFYVSYRYQVTETGLTDISPGSVLRTTLESVAIQIYRAFLKTQEVGRDSFVDTAIGSRLDLLGRLVGITRNEASRTTGYVTLRREPTNTTSTVDIPIGTRLATVGSSTTPVVFFQTTSTGRINQGETIAVTYTSADDPDYLQPWIAVEALSLGEDGNINSGSLVRNINAPATITYVNNPSTYDVSGEQITGDGTSQTFNLAHPPTSTASLGAKYIQYKQGFISQPSSATQIKFTLDVHASADYDNGSGEYVAVKIFGENSGGSAINETWNLDDTTTTQTTTNSFAKIFYVTFTNQPAGSGGIGEGVGANSTIDIENSAQTETYLDAQAPGDQVDSGHLDMIADADYIQVWIWQDNSWREKTLGATGSGSNHFYYVDEDTGSYDAGVLYWNDGGGSTWTGSSPYYSNYAAGPDADGQNIKIEYYPIAGETGTGEAEDISSGITAFTIAQEYKYGWVDQPSAAGDNISVSCTNGSGVDASWDGTVVVHGTTTTGGSQDEEALIFDSGVPDYEQETSKEFSKIDYVTFSNANNPSEGFGEGSASATYVRIGTTTKGSDIMDESQCGTRVDGGYLSLIGVDSDNTLKVYVYNSGWSLHTQAAADYTYTDEGSTAGVVDWGATWDWSTPPYVNEHDAGPFGDGRNIMIEYVPIVTEYDTADDQLLLEGALTNGSIGTLSYTWSNAYSDGTDTETDTAYRRRISASIATSAKGTLDAIEAAVLAIDGIEGVVVDDYSTNPTIPIGEVHVFAWTSSGLLEGGYRALVAGAVNDTRAAGVKPVVASPTPIYVAIHATVKVPSTSSRTLTAIKTDADAAVASYINGLGINRYMYKSELIDVIEAIPEVTYVDVSTIKVWGYDSNTATTVSTVTPYTSSPNWYFDEGVTQDWSSSGNIIYINSGYVFIADTDDEGTNNEGIDITVEYE